MFSNPLKLLWLLSLPHFRRGLFQSASFIVLIISNFNKEYNAFYWTSLYIHQTVHLLTAQEFCANFICMSVSHRVARTFKCKNSFWKLRKEMNITYRSNNKFAKSQIQKYCLLLVKIWIILKILYMLIKFIYLEK